MSNMDKSIYKLNRDLENYLKNVYPHDKLLQFIEKATLIQLINLNMMWVAGKDFELTHYIDTVIHNY